MSIFIHNKIVARTGNKNHKMLKSMGIFGVQDALKKTGVSQPTLSRWVKDGLIKNIDRGLYIHPESKIPPEEFDFAIACYRFGPLSTIGGLSALFYYGLIDQVPQQIWVVIPPTKKNESSKKRYKCLRTKTSIKYGVGKHKFFRITSVERTLLEAMKFSKKIGPRIVIAASRKALKEGMTTETKIGKMASQLEMKNVLEKFWEAIVL